MSQEFSIILAGAGGNLCNMKCTYCSATGVTEKDKPGCKEWPIEIDYDAMFKTMESNPIIKEALAKNEELTINLWGGDPLMHTKEWDELVPKIKEHFPNLKFRVYLSTNGLLCGAKHIQEWIYDFNKKFGLTIQLSHDGVGQWIRSKGFDPLYDHKTKDFFIKMAKDGIFNMINATLNQFNCSPISNFAYFQKWRYDNHLEHLPFYIKLNHLNDSEYCGPYRLSGEKLNRYMDEMQTLWMKSYVARREDPYWQPYRDYFVNQMTRWNKFTNLGGCGMFSTGQRDWTWCMNTKGEYVFCQLCNDPESNPNPECKQGPECEHCEFRDYDDCHGCPDMVFGEHCEYKKEYIRAVLRTKIFIETVEAQKKAIQNLEQQLKNKSCNCNNPRNA